MEGKRLSLLLVEDNPGDALLLRVTLSEAGADYNLEHVERLAKALERLQQGGIDAVLLDLSLPDSQGVAAIQRIREQAPEVAILVLSGQDDEETAIRAMQEGAQNYLVKWRFGIGLLQRAISFAVEQQRRMVALERQAARCRDLAALLDAVAAHINQGLLITGPDGTIRYANPPAAALLGASPADLIGTACPVTATPGEVATYAATGEDGRQLSLQARAFTVRWEGQPASLLLLDGG